MNVPTITMDKQAAAAKLKAFRAAKHKDAEEVYRRAATAYEQLAAGRPLLQLSQALITAGHDQNGRPNVAICRADRKEVCVDYPSWRKRAIEFSAGPFHSPRQIAQVNPLLLQHIEGDLWAVLAQWDLTEIERAILGASL
jgi:hypothetical protein